MLTIIVLVFMLIIFDIAAMRWGFTSNDGPESKEWERRRQHAWLRECAKAHSVKHIGEKCQSNLTADVRRTCVSCVGDR